MGWIQGLQTQKVLIFCTYNLSIQTRKKQKKKQHKNYCVATINYKWLLCPFPSSLIDLLIFNPDIENSIRFLHKHNLCYVGCWIPSALSGDVLCCYFVVFCCFSQSYLKPLRRTTFYDYYLRWTWLRYFIISTLSHFICCAAYFLLLLLLLRCCLIACRMLILAYS